MGTGLGGQLGQGAVVVQAGHGGEARGRHVRGVGGSDEGVGVGRVAHDQDLDVLSGAGVDGLTLGAEDAAVGRQQVRALHAGLTRHRTNEEGDVGALEGLLRVVEDVDRAERGEGGVEQLHGRALGGLDCLRDLKQAQVDALVRAEQGAGGDAEQQRVTDVAGGTGDGDVDGGVSHEGLLLGLVGLTRPCAHDPVTRAARGAAHGKAYGPGAERVRDDGRFSVRPRRHPRHTGRAELTSPVCPRP